MSRQVRRPGIAQGLRDLADFLDEHVDLVDERNQPGQHEDVTFIVRDVATVAAIAEHADTLVTADADREGNVHTSTEIGFGRGSSDEGTPAYTNAVTLRVVHVQAAS